MHAFFLVLCALVAASWGQLATAAEADPALVNQGRYLAIAGDCAACHGKSFKGGDAVASPIGNIYAANITPDKATGIGSWTLPETDLPFPFYRPMMGFWNALFLNQGRSTGSIAVSGDVRQRGQLLVETLGHCAACHTPRGMFMEQDSKRHLAGAMIGGWWAPNITPDRSGIGIGNWSDERLSTFLTTGHSEVALAAGDMGKVVSDSLSQLSRPDIGAVMAYLRAVPAVASNQPPNVRASDTSTVESGFSEPVELADWQRVLGHDSVQGGVLYQSACASCHGVDGAGSVDLKHPSLRQVTAVRGPQGATLVQVIAHGVNREVGAAHTLMPAFRHSLNDAQIAALANHVRTRFGGIESQISAWQVAQILDGQLDTPWLIQNAKWLAVLAIGVAMLLVVALIRVSVRALGARHAVHR